MEGKRDIIDTSDCNLKYKRVDGSSYVFIEEIQEWVLNLNDIHGSPDDPVSICGKDDVFRWLDEN